MNGWLPCINPDVNIWHHLMILCGPLLICLHHQLPLMHKEMFLHCLGNTAENLTIGQQWPWHICAASQGVIYEFEFKYWYIFQGTQFDTQQQQSIKNNSVPSKLTAPETITRTWLSPVSCVLTAPYATLPLDRKPCLVPGSDWSLSVSAKDSHTRSWTMI